MRRHRLPERIFAWVEGELGIARAALPAVDRFWLLKDRVYDQVINLPSNILAEARLCELVSSEIDRAVLEGLAHFDDPALRERIGDERIDRAAIVSREDLDYELWASADYGERVGAKARVPVMVRVRKRYYVDPGVEAGAQGLALSRWSHRYRHEKTRAWLVSRRCDQLRLPLPQTVFADPPASEAPEI